MPGAEISFSQYATAFYTIIEGGKGNKSKFVKTLLCMGVSDNGRKTIEELFPTKTHSKGNTSIISDRLRKYLRGENGISKIADEIYAALEHESHDAYIQELEDYEDSRLIEFAQQLQLDTDLGNISAVREAIAACYYSIIEKASIKSVAAKDESNGSKDIVLSYTITETDKRAIKNLCELINKSLIFIEHQTRAIDRKQFDLKKLTNFEKEAKWKAFLESDITLLKKRFDDSYSELKKWCDKAVELLEPKRHLDPCLEIIYNIADGIDSNKYKITCPAEFDYSAFSLMISEFKKSYNLLLRCIDKL